MAASATPDLDAGPLPLSWIREDARRSLVDILDSTRGKKLLVLDPKISGFLSLLAEVGLFKEHGVEQLQHLGPEPLGDVAARAVIFLVRSRVENAQLVAQRVKECQESGRQQEYAVYFIPRRTIVCERVFQERGLAADVSLGELALDFVPFDCDLLSLEQDAAFCEVAVDGDWGSSFCMARGLMQLQRMFGPIPVVKGAGRAASDVADMLGRMTQAEDTALPGISAIDELVLLDREVDCVTPMCTQHTYEGLLDEVMGIRNGALQYTPKGRPKQRFALNSGDATFAHIRDWHAGAVGNWLHNQATSFQAGYRESKEAEVHELKAFTSRLTAFPRIDRHVELLGALWGLCERSAFSERLAVERALLEGGPADPAYALIEDMMCGEESVESVLRLICLASLTQGGLPKRNFDSLRRDVLHTYGHQHLLTLQALQTAGLLRLPKGGRPAFAQLSRALKLCADPPDPKNPTDPGYVYNGYTPISIRLVEAALRTPAWSGMPEEALKLLPGPCFTRKQPHLGGQSPGPSVRRRVVLVVFLGGVTFAEVSALRFLQARPEAGVDFLVATSKLVNGTTLLSSLQEDVVREASACALLS